MATLPTKAGAVTLTDFAKTLDPNGTVAAVIELLSQNNDAMNDILWKEGNLPTGHQTTVLTGLPTSTWRKMYKGTQPSKSSRAQITDTCGILEQRSEIDKDVADLTLPEAAYLAILPKAPSNYDPVRQTQRALDNFQVSGLRMPRAFLRGLGLIKASCARVNRELGTATAVITHNAPIAEIADRVVVLADGRVQNEQHVGRRARPAELRW